MKKNIRWITALLLAVLLLTSVVCTAFASPTVLNPGDLHPMHSYGKKIASKSFDGKKIGIALGGGGLRGSYEIGAMEALRDLGLYDDIAAISGTSIGAVNAVCLAGTDLDTVKNAWLTLKPTDTFQPQKGDFWSDGLFTKEGISSLLDETVAMEQVKHSAIDTYICVARQVTPLYYVPEYHRSADLSPEEIKQYVLASASIPVVFSPEHIHGKTYYDGGLCDAVPIEPLYQNGIRDIIAFSISSIHTGIGSYPNANFCMVASKDATILNELDSADMSLYHLYYRYALGYYETYETVSAYQAGRRADLHKLSDYADDYAERMMKANTFTVRSNLYTLTKRIGSLIHSWIF